MAETKKNLHAPLPADLHDEIYAYALAMAGSGADLDEDFEAASIAAWLDSDP